MSITPSSPGQAKGERFEHGSVLGGKTRAARVSSQWKSTERGIEPHVNLIDKAERTDGTFSRSDFAFDTERDLYVPEAKS